jgi:hypothetical protein
MKARNRIIRVRVNDEEYKDIWTQAGGSDLSTYLRDLATSSEAEIRKLRAWKERAIPVLESLKFVKHESEATEMKLRFIINILLEP